jgi:hypothetical protein
MARARDWVKTVTQRRALASAAVFAALAAGVLAPKAVAFHIPGAAYSGTVSGGGTISFSVSGDGSSVTNLTLNGPIGRAECTVDSKQYRQPIPITGQSFDNGEVSGSFPDVQGAYGRFNIVVSGLLSSCRITGTWSAITRADPAGSEECKTAQADMTHAKRALKKARRAGNERKIRKLRQRWAKAKSRRDQFC